MTVLFSLQMSLSGMFGNFSPLIGLLSGITTKDVRANGLFTFLMSKIYFLKIFILSSSILDGTTDYKRNNHLVPITVTEEKFVENLISIVV